MSEHSRHAEAHIDSIVKQEEAYAQFLLAKMFEAEKAAQSTPLPQRSTLSLPRPMASPRPNTALEF
jgi:hypothetical protein